MTSCTGSKIAVVVVSGLLVLAGSAVTLVGSLRNAPAAGYDPPPVDFSLADRVAEGGEVEWVSDHLAVVGGLKVVHIWGSPREMGRQHGEAVAEAVKGVRDVYLRRTVTEDWGYSREYQLTCAEAMLQHIPEAYVEEMRGVAEGSGVDFEDILLLHTHADTAHFGKEWTDGGAAPVMGCSNFVAFGEATVGGDVFHGRNLDWTIKTGVQEHAILLIAEPEGGVPFALLTYAGGIGGVTGMNAEGITFGEMTSQTADETLDGLPLFFACRRILDSCRDLGEVEEFVLHYPGTTGWNFMIADGEARDARAFEVDAVRRVAFRPNDPGEAHPPLSQPIPCAIRRTNHPVSPEVQESVARRVDLPNLHLARAAVPALDTWHRYAALGEWIAEDHWGTVDDRTARAMLQTRPVAAGNTLHSAVFNATEHVLWVANASLDEPAWKQVYVRLDLDDWIGRRP
jgi:hypothetical protein